MIRQRPRWRSRSRTRTRESLWTIPTEPPTRSRFAIWATRTPRLMRSSSCRFVEGGREYWDEIYAKGASLYDGALNTTRRWMDDYQESGRSHKPIRVDLYVDAADPYSLELILGPVQHLLRMDLGPPVNFWSIKPHSNIGQDRAKRVKCGETTRGRAPRGSVARRTQSSRARGARRTSPPASVCETRERCAPRESSGPALDPGTRAPSGNLFAASEVYRRDRERSSRARTRASTM